MMKRQKSDGNKNDSYLVKSIEEGVRKITDENYANVILGGRETLYFNTKRQGFNLIYK